jgi:serine/threonine protein kinase
MSIARIENAFNPGDMLLDRYEVFGKDRGGFGVVIFVRDTETGQYLAVKIPIPETPDHRAEIEAFASEVRFWLELDPHPNVVKVHYLREVLGLPALFMDFIDGGSLRRRLRAGPLNEDAAISAAYQLATAMEFVNRKGEIAHLDLKPENLLFHEDLLKVTDFGLAHRVRVVHGSYVRPDSATWRYAAPEIFAGGVGDTRSDIYSFGLIVYEMFCGRLPYPFRLAGDPDETYERLAQFHKHFGMSGVSKDLYHSGIPGCSNRELGIIASGCVAPYAGERHESFRDLLEMLERTVKPQQRRYVEQDLSTQEVFERAMALRNMGQLSQALSKFNELLIKEQHVAIYWREAARALDASGDHFTAGTFEQRAAELDAGVHRNE